MPAAMEGLLLVVLNLKIFGGGLRDQRTIWCSFCIFFLLLVCLILKKSFGFW
jgi:hypothetical protein